MKADVFRTPLFQLWGAGCLLALVTAGGQGATHQGGAGDESARSLHSEVQTSMTFCNRTAGTVRIYWLDFSGRPVLYFILDPGNQVQQATYVSHPWMAADSEGAPLAVFYPSERPLEVDVVSPIEDGENEPR